MKKPLVIIINGVGGVGKDTICDIVGKYYKTMIVSTITDVKKAGSLIGWQGSKSLKDRGFLSDLKDLCTEYYDYPFKKAVSDYESFLNTHDDILFIYVREPQEIEKLRLYIKKDGRADICTLLIKSDRFSQSYGNHADDDVELYNYDYIFNNNCSIEELEDSFMEFFKGRIINE